MKVYEYETTDHCSYPRTYEWDFKKMVTGGWRLVSVVKAAKGDFLCYWEKEVK